MEFGTGILLVLTIDCFLARSQEIKIKPNRTGGVIPMDFLPDEKDAEILNDEEIADLMSLDLGTTSPPLETNASLLAIIESLGNSGSPVPDPLPGSPEIAPAPTAESPKNTFFRPILPVEEEIPRYPSPLLTEAILEGIPADVYRNRPYNLFLPRGHVIRPNLVLKPPRENRLPPFQTLMPMAKESFFPLTIQHLQGLEKVRVNTYGILKPVKLNVALAQAAMANPQLFMQAQAGYPPRQNLIDQSPPPNRQENMERFRRFANPSNQFNPPTTAPRPPIPMQIPYSQQPIPYQQMSTYGYPQQPHLVPFYPVYVQENLYPRNMPMVGVSQSPYPMNRGQPMGMNQMPPYMPAQRHQGQEMVPPIAYGGGSADPYKLNQMNAAVRPGSNYQEFPNSSYMAHSPFPVGSYVRPPPYPQYLHPQQQLMPFHANQQGGYPYQHQQPPYQSRPYSQQETYGQGIFKPRPNASHGPGVGETPPLAAIGSERAPGNPVRVSPTTYYGSGQFNKWPTQGTRGEVYSSVPGGETGRSFGQNRPTVVPSQSNDPAAGRTRVNPYVHFRGVEQGGQPLQLQPANPNNNTIPRLGPSGNFTLPESRSEIEGQGAKPEGGEVPKVPVLPSPRRPMPFYSQAAVDSHYRRMSAHNETTGDKEFEDDSQLLQWYVQRAKQVLRERDGNGKERNGNQEYNTNSSEVALPVRINQERRRRSIIESAANDIRLPISESGFTGPGWNQFKSEWTGGDNGIGGIQEPSTNPSSAETDQLFRKIWDSTGLAFNGSVILPNRLL